MRKIFRAAHLWVGLVAGVFILAMALSGALILFRTDIGGFQVPAPPEWSEIERQVAAECPEAQISRILFPQAPGGLLRIQASKSDKQRVDIFADPESGKVLYVKQPLAWLAWVLERQGALRPGSWARHS